MVAVHAVVESFEILASYSASVVESSYQGLKKDGGVVNVDLSTPEEGLSPGDNDAGPGTFVNYFLE